MKTKTILIFGLPGSGKTYISKCLLEHLDADHFNADAIRAQHDDWDFSEEGRLRQVHRMKDLCRDSDKPFAIMDFVCPFTQGRQILNPDYIIFMDTIEKGRYADTNKAFQRPLKNEVDYWVEDQNGELHSEVIARELLAENRRFDINKPTTQMLGRFQPFHDCHLALFKRCYDKTGQVCIMIRAMKNSKKNPFDFKTVKQNIKMFLLGEGYEENVHFIIQKVPNIVNITYGRDVGYKIEQESFDKETESISATEIRRQLGLTK